MVSNNNLVMGWHNLVLAGEECICDENFETGIGLFSSAIELCPNDFYGYSRRGLCYMYLDQFGRAKEDFDSAIQCGPSQQDGYAYRATALLQEGHYDDSFVDIEKAIDLGPEKNICYVVRGCIYAAENKLQEALHDFNRAIALDPCDQESRQARAEVYFAGHIWDIRNRTNCNIGNLEFVDECGVVIATVTIDIDRAAQIRYLFEKQFCLSDESYSGFSFSSDRIEDVVDTLNKIGLWCYQRC